MTPVRLGLGRIAVMRRKRSGAVMDFSPLFVTQPDGFRRERAGDDPAERDGGVEHVLHTSSS